MYVTNNFFSARCGHSNDYPEHMSYLSRQLSDRKQKNQTAARQTGRKFCSLCHQGIGQCDKALRVGSRIIDIKWANTLD